MEAGEVWAYRERARSRDCPLERVEYLGAAPTGNKCRIRFLDRGGQEETVPRGRLIVLWDGREDLLQHEGRMAALVAVSAHAYETPQFNAVSSLIVWGFIEGVDLGYSQDELGTVQIEDAELLCRTMGMDYEALMQEPLSFIDDGRFVGPFSVAVKIAERAAELNGEAVMEKVLEEEAVIELKSVHGQKYRIGRDEEERWIPPDRLKDWHAEKLMKLNVVRGWCGREVLERLDELDALRGEVRRLGWLMERAILELRRCGQDAIAATMETDLGVPVSRLALRGRGRKKQGG